MLGPFLATLLHGLSRAVLGADRTLVVGDVSFFLPGVRLALFLAGIIMVVAGVLSILCDGSGVPRALLEVDDVVLTGDRVVESFKVVYQA